MSSKNIDIKNIDIKNIDIKNIDIKNIDIKNIEVLKKMSKNLKKLRTKKNYTQMYVSFQIGIDIRLYQKYESNNPPDIRLTNLLKILNFYNIPLNTLLK